MRLAEHLHRAPISSRMGKRNSEETRERILAAAITEFSEHGYPGARIDRIARRSHTNTRMLYHYFNNKEGLYIAALERIYAGISEGEQRLDLEHLEPVEAMEALIDFTFKYIEDHEEMVWLIANENMMRAAYLRKSAHAPSVTRPLTAAIKNILKRGQRDGLFRHRVDPIQLYVSIVAQSWVHITNRYTFSTMFRKDIGDPKWCSERRRHAREMIMTYLMYEPGSK